MARRKKYPKLPNGFGSIKYLGKHRRNPYAVHPPTEEFNEDGIPKTPKAICYVDDWMKGFAVLTAYKAGTYTPGMEKDLLVVPDSDSKGLVQRILTDYSIVRGSEPDEPEKTFSDVYKEFYDYKFNRDKSKTYSKSTLYSTRAAYNNCAALHDREFRSLRHEDLQAVVDNCNLKHSSLELIVSLLKQMYDYADIYELCDKNYAAHVKINREDDDESGVPFLESELKKLWENKNNDTVEFILIMCYSGFRISAYETLKVDLTDNYFQGGVKTSAGKDRIVPIHSAILPLVKARMKRYGMLMNVRSDIMRNNMYNVLEELRIPKHTPHDCRHTFSMLCEKYGVNENDRKRMLGHSFGNDITNRVYGHKELSDLCTEIEKIKVCY